MTLRWLLLAPLLSGPACQQAECGTGFTINAEGACVVKLAGDCPDGTIRTLAGECEEPYSTTNNTVDPPDDTDPIDSDTDPGDSDTDPVGGSCAHTVQITTGTFADEVGWQITPPGGTPIITGAPPGTYSDSSDYSVPVELPAGDYVLSMVDTFGDGWNTTQLRITHDDSGVAVLTASLDQGTSDSATFSSGCN